MQQGYFWEKTPPSIQKKAGALALSLFAVLWCLFWTLQYVPPAPLPPPENEGIEVNLGDAATGSGPTPPQGQPHASPHPAATNPSPAAPPTAEQRPHPPAAVKQVVSIPVPAKPSAHTVAATPAPKSTLPNQPTAATTKLPPPDPGPEPLPPPPQPKALLRAGALSTGASAPAGAANKTPGPMGMPNGQGKSQGIAGGPGDQGDPRGNPNSNNYTGNAPSGSTGPGVRIRNGLSGRKLVKLPQFEDDFTENAKVAVDIVVDGSGKVLEASINPRGTTTANATIRAIALRKAKSLQLSPSAEATENGTLVFVFEVHQ